MVAIWLRSPHSARNVSENDLRKIWEKMSDSRRLTSDTVVRREPPFLSSSGSPFALLLPPEGAGAAHQ